MQPLSYIAITFSICAVAVAAVHHMSLSAYMAFLQLHHLSILSDAYIAVIIRNTSNVHIHSYKSYQIKQTGTWKKKKSFYISPMRPSI